jgi:hypothetical protein
MEPKQVGSILLLMLGGYFIVFNWSCIWRYVRKGEHESWIPLVGGFFGCGGCLGIPALSEYWGVPWVVDWGSLPGFTFTLAYFGIWFWRRRRNGSQDTGEHGAGPS